MDEKIYVNIWDDFAVSDDNDNNENCNKTHAYVECELNDHDSREVLFLIMKKIEENFPDRKFNMELVYFDPAEKFKNISKEYQSLLKKHWRIVFTHVNYDNISDITEILIPLNITYNQIPVDIYSES